MLGQLTPLGKGESIELTKERLLVGSHRFCDVVIHSTQVAPVHCQLVLRDYWWYIRNLATTHETKVNGLSVAEQRLEPGDIIWLGPVYKYQIRYDAEEITNHMLAQQSPEPKD